MCASRTSRRFATRASARFSRSFLHTNARARRLAHLREGVDGLGEPRLLPVRASYLLQVEGDKVGLLREEELAQLGEPHAQRRRQLVEDAAHVVRDQQHRQAHGARRSRALLLLLCSGLRVSRTSSSPRWFGCA
eukprot:5717623-Pleurochrysis_carterae.AAC.2